MSNAVLLFRSELLARLLAIILLNPDRVWTSRDLAARLDAHGVSTHRELRRALSAGVITREAVGRTYLYRAAVESPLFEPLRALLERTIGVETELRETLSDVPGVEAAFLHGSFAQAGDLRPTSDVDVLVLGDVDLRSLRRRLRDIERRAGREVDVLAYTREEFEELGRAGNSLARAIARGPITALVGSVDDLPTVA